MMRLSRAGREYAIKVAIKRLVAKGKYKMFTKGEICRAMGIKSTSRIRNMLDSMVESKELLGATTAIDGYSHEINIYGLAHEQLLYCQTIHPIMINGVEMFLMSNELKGE